MSHDQWKDTKYTLLTNVSFMQFDENIRCNCYAVLITEGSPAMISSDLQYTIRAFGTDPADDRLQIWLNKEQLPFTIEPAEFKNHILFTHDGKEKPIFSGSYLNLADGKKYFLQSATSEHPIDIYTNTGEIPSVWKELRLRTVKYWDAPSIPTLSWVRTHDLRKLYEHGPNFANM